MLRGARLTEDGREFFFLLPESPSNHTPWGNMPEILLGEQRGKAKSGVSPDALAGHAARVFAAAGAVLLVGVLIDLFTLWGLQRQDTIQWEFVALGTTTNSFPLLLLSVVLFYGALALRRTDSVTSYRLAAALVILLAAFGLTVGFLIGTNYLAVTRSATPSVQAAPIIKSMVVKAGGLCLVFGGVMAVVGVLGLRMPKQS